MFSRGREPSATERRGSRPSSARSGLHSDTRSHGSFRSGSECVACNSFAARLISSLGSQHREARGFDRACECRLLTLGGVRAVVVATDVNRKIRTTCSTSGEVGGPGSRGSPNGEVPVPRNRLLQRGLVYTRALRSLLDVRVA